MVKTLNEKMDDKLHKDLVKIKGNRTWREFFEDIVKEHKSK